jgi:hypothetical protein
MAVRSSERGGRDRSLTPEEATRNIDPREVEQLPKEAWTREDFLRDLRRATRRRNKDAKGDDPQPA